MNPIVQKQIDRLMANLEVLSETLAEQQARIEKHVEDRETMQKDSWRRQKELSTLQHVSEDYDVLKAENDRLARERAELEERLRAVLQHTRSLANAYRP